MIRVLRHHLALVGLTVAVVVTHNVHAQTSDAKPLRIIVPFAPGGAGDVVARLIAPGLAERLQRPVLVENKPGGSTILAADYVAKAPADGNTVLLTTEATLAINPSLHAKLPYNAQKDFVPITMVVNMPLVLVASSTVTASNVAQLIDHAKRAPGELSYASVGGGSPQQLAMVLFNKLSDTRMNHIPYKGGAPAISDVAGGQVNLFFAAIGTAAPHLASGRVKAIGLTGIKRHPALPNVPTIAEAGLPGYETSVWLGLLGPAGMPVQLIEQLQTEVARLIIQPQYLDRWLALGAEPIGSTPVKFAEAIRTDAQKWSAIIREANVKAD